MSHKDAQIIDLLNRWLSPIKDSIAQSQQLMDLIGEARFVLIGEASHGTYEFYRERAELTKRLITERGFTAVAVEADWPDAYRVNRYVHGQSNDRNADAALSDFQRFPQWMWRNEVMIDFVQWLCAYNAQLPPAQQVGFYGLDLYSLHSSIAAILKYLDQIDPTAARRARERYSCFDHFARDAQAYGYAASLDLAWSCEDEVVAQLLELQQRAQELAYLDGRVAADEFFSVEQNAILVKNAEEYYRSMFRGQVASWNLRDQHMAETLIALANHLGTTERDSKIAVWEHNSHLGDARATELGERGEWNVGQLVRELYGSEAYLIGFSTYQGTVTAASQWDMPAEHKRVRPALTGSYEALFHRLSEPNFLIDLNNEQLQSVLREPRLQRAIGVIYLPETERHSHYFYARLADQFDAIIHLDHTRAIEPLEKSPHWQVMEDLPETFPSGM